MTARALGSRYLLDERIGHGGMGIVWRGRDRNTGASYAIKVLRPECAADPDAVARFVRERTALIAFRHPHVVSVHDMIVEGDDLALVMDLVPAGDLDRYRQNRGGRLPAAEAAGIAAQICDGLAAAHAAGIMHRDLKPSNILVGNGQAWLADFGIARVAGQQSFTTSGEVFGTAAYLAPEVISGSEPSPAGDVYSLGITLYELLAGDTPFRGHIAAILIAHVEHLPVRPDGVPDGLWQLIDACLRKNPADRPSAADLAPRFRAVALAEDATERFAMPVANVPAQAPAAAAPEAETTGPEGAGPTAPEGPGPGEPEEGREEGGRRKIAVMAGVVVAAAAALFALTAYGPLSGGDHDHAEASIGTPKIGSAATPAPSSRTSPRPKGNPVRQAGPNATPRTSAHPSAGASSSPKASPKPAPSSSSSPSASPTPGSGPQSQCGATSTQTGALLPESTRACISVSGSTVTLQGWLSSVPLGLLLSEPQEIALVMTTPAGAVTQYLSPQCTSSQCSFSQNVMPAPGKYQVRADLVSDGDDQFEGTPTGYVTVG